ncbi:MAG: hypothetical protein ACLR8U_14010 [Oscillospiraceae bacterium]
MATAWENDLNIFFAQITPNKYLEERIFNSIVSKDEIADEASPELSSIRRKIRRQSVAIREGLQRSSRLRPTQNFCRSRS